MSKKESKKAAFSRLLCEGYSEKEIAAILDVTDRTIRNYKTEHKNNNSRAFIDSNILFGMAIDTAILRKEEAARKLNIGRKTLYNWEQSEAGNDYQRNICIFLKALGCSDSEIAERALTDMKNAKRHILCVNSLPEIARSLSVIIDAFNFCSEYNSSYLRDSTKLKRSLDRILEVIAKAEN